MRLTILGTSTPYPRPGNPCSGYLVQSESTALWMDAGTGTLAELQRHIPLDRLDAIWISHTHADHAADLLTAYYALRFSGLELAHPIPLFGPPALIDRMVGFLGPQAASVIPTVLDFTAMNRSGHQRVGDLTLRWRRVQHGMPAFGVRIESPDAVLAYFGDSGPCDALVDLASGATALLCEAGESDHGGVNTPVHCTPEEAGAVASAADVGRLMMTHVGGDLSNEQAAYRAQSTFRGQIDIARPGHVVDVTSR